MSARSRNPDGADNAARPRRAPQRKPIRPKPGSRDSTKVRSRGDLEHVLAAATHVAVIVTDTDGLITNWNTGAERMLGYPAMGTVGKRSALTLYLEAELAAHGEVLSQEFGERIDGFEVLVARARRGGYDEGEWTYVRQDGSHLTVSLAVSAVRNEAGRITRFLGTALDITERKQAEEAAREGEERYRALFDRSLDCVSLVDFTGRFLDMNQAMLGLLGYQRSDIPTLTLASVLSADQIQPAQDRIRAILATGSQTPTEYAVRCKDGRIIFAETQSSLIVRGGEPYAVQVIGRDITERKRREEALLESEARFRAIVNLAPDGIFIASIDGCILEANEAAARQLGVSRARLLEMRLTDFVAPRYASRLGQVGDQPEHPAFRESAHLRPDGTEVPIELHVRRINFRGKPAMLGVARDVTERKRAEAEREKLHAQLVQAQKMESVGRLAGGVAHDFNNMLTVIQGNAELVLEALPSESPERPTLEEIRKCAQRSAELTGQLLAFARKQIIAPKVLDLNKTVERMLKMIGRLIGEDIDLTWRPGSSLGAVHMDPSQVDQILANLCVNARDAIGGRAGKVTIETANVILDETYTVSHPEARAGCWVRLAVSDDGCGMPQEVKARLFEPFFTTKAQGQGTGLGLAMVYGIVTQNDGFIIVSSEPGRGTVFAIYLPPHAGPAVTSGAREGAAATPGRGMETILLVEDEPAILRMIQRVLGDLGYRVLVTRTPSEAIQLAREHLGAIDLLVTDVVMPEMNGRILAQNLIGEHPNLKALFVSGYTADVIAPPRGCWIPVCISSRSRSRFRACQRKCARRWKTSRSAAAKAPQLGKRSRNLNEFIPRFCPAGRSACARHRLPCSSALNCRLPCGRPRTPALGGVSVSGKCVHQSGRSDSKSDPETVVQGERETPWKDRLRRRMGSLQFST